MSELVVVGIFCFVAGVVTAGLLAMFRFKSLEDQIDALSEDCLYFSEKYYFRPKDEDGKEKNDD